jgi:acyl-CoA reductase-like NAD-dependent aldehyde dehydrogenase
LAARLGERLVSSTLELSGSDAQFVMADADVRLAARAAWFGMTVNRGQTCIAVRRAFVHRSRHAEFLDTLRPLVEKSSPMPLTLPSQGRQVDHFVEDALARGGKLLVDRPAGREAGCHPTVLIDATPEMAACREAAFAPVMAVLPFDDWEQAVAMERECPYALAASIFTADTVTARFLANELRAGAVTINDVVVPTAHPATPFGGTGQSGWGVTQGAEGLLEMTVPQVVSVKGGAFRPHYDMGDPQKLQGQGELLRGFLEAGHAPGFGQRLRGWWRVVRAAMRGV